MDIRIREMNDADAKTVCVLSKQLGYAVPEENTVAQILLINNSSNDAAYVAVHDNEVIAWIHIFLALHLKLQPFCEVAALVVEERYRGKGVGKILLEKAVEWTNGKNCKRLMIRSNVRRKEAHQFYLNIGFKEIKQQKIFELTLI
jgi:GNAT superfamily N-acetyltransferase